MAGYCGYAKSNNAIDAEERESYPASRLAKRLGCKSTAVKALLSPAEWHHTSCRFNCTDYYDEPVLLALADGDLRYGLEAAGRDKVAVRRQARLLAELRAYGRGAKTDRRWTGCTVRWLEWSGTRRRPRATECSASDCTITHKSGGAMVTIAQTNGCVFRKKIGTRGLEADLPDGTPLIRDYMDCLEAA